jgi:NADH-quinone oxidoreductase subunit G
VRESWRWLLDVKKALGDESRAWESVDDVIEDLCRTFAALAAALRAAPPAEFRMLGMKIPRQPNRHSGRTAMDADRVVFEARPPDDPDSPLAFSMEGFEGQPPPALIGRVWAPGWNSAQALEKFRDEVGGALRGGDPGKRLFEPPTVDRPYHFLDVPAAYSPERDQTLVVPVHHIFGSEELSMKAPGVRACAPEPYLGLGDSTAERLGIRDGVIVTLVSDAGVRLLKAKLLPSLPEDVAVIPAGLPELEGLGAPFYARLIVRRDADA